MPQARFWMVLTSLVVVACGAQNAGDQTAQGGGYGGVGAMGGAGGTGPCVDCGVEPKDTAGLQDEEGALAVGNPQAGLDALCEQLPQAGRLVSASLGDANSFASPALAHALLAEGIAPIPDFIRSQDFLNAFPPSPTDLGQPPEVGDGPRAAAAIRNTDGERQYELLVVVEAPALKMTSGRIVLLLDDTASMGPEAESPLARTKSIALYIETLAHAQGVELELRTVSGSALASVEELTLKDHESSVNAALQAAIDGSGRGLQAGDRVILISDGKDDPDLLPKDALKYAADVGATVSGISTASPLTHTDRYFRGLNFAGRGYYVFAGTDASVAESLALVPQMLRTALYDVRLKVQLPWYFQLVKPTTEETVTLDAALPQDLGAGGAHVFLLRFEACDAALPTGDGYQEPASVQVLYRASPKASEDDVITVEVADFQGLYESKGAFATERMGAIHGVAEALKTFDRAALEQAKATLDAVVQKSNGDLRLESLNSALAGHPLLSP